MMGRHDILSQMLQPRFQIVRNPLGQSACVDKHQRGTMGLHQFGDSIVDIRPNRVGGDGSQFIFGDLHAEVHLATMADVHNDRTRPPAGQKLRDGLNRTLRGGQADALGLHGGERFQSLQ